MYEKRMTRLFSIMLILYVIFVGISVAGIQLYLYPYILICLIAFTKNKGIFRINNFLQKMLFMMFIFTVFVNLFNNRLEVDYAIKMAILCITPSILSKGIVHEKIYKKLFAVLLLGVAVSCLVATFQSLEMEWAYNLWERKFNVGTQRYEELMWSMKNGRSPGLASYSLNLGFQIVQLFPLSLAGLADNDIKTTRWWCFYRVALALLLIGCASSGMRMAIIVCGSEILLYILMTHRYTKKQILVAGVFIILVVLIYIFYLQDTPIIQNMLNRMSLLGTSSGAISSRLESYYTVLSQHIDSNPLQFFFGHGSGSINELTSQYEILGSGHNFLISSLYEFGLVGLLVVVIFYGRLISELWRLRNKSICKAVLCGVLGYLITSLTNDSYLLGADFFHIIYIVICLSFLTNCRESWGCNVAVI